jgi:prepilin-type N-terminal cleavage/methylation domain-containing protein
MPHRKGFTIIEVLIVLAVAALILLVIFLAVPALRRNERNYDRKHFVDLTAAALDEYKGSYGGYPNDQASMCTFINNYLDKLAGGGGTCTPSYNGAKDCVLVTSKRYTLCYHEADTSLHSYLGPEDEISIQLAHWCTPNPNTTGFDIGNPITSGGSPVDNAYDRYVIWTKQEGSGTYCVDNYPG